MPSPAAFRADLAYAHSAGVGMSSANGVYILIFTFPISGTRSTTTRSHPALTPKPSLLILTHHKRLWRNWQTRKIQVLVPTRCAGSTPVSRIEKALEIADFKGFFSLQPLGKTSF